METVTSCNSQAIATRFLQAAAALQGPTQSQSQPESPEFMLFFCHMQRFRNVSLWRWNLHFSPDSQPPQTRRIAPSTAGPRPCQHAAISWPGPDCHVSRVTLVLAILAIILSRRPEPVGPTPHRITSSRRLLTIAMPEIAAASHCCRPPSPPEVVRNNRPSPLPGRVCRFLPNP